MPITLGAMIGNTTCQNDCHGVAPWSRAASSHARLNRLNTANMISKPNGSVQVNCAPNAELYQSGSRSSALNNNPTPRLTKIDGMIRLATLRVNSAVEPAKRRRNAMPAASDTTTVVAITMVANANDRASEPPKSPTAWVSNNRRNQWNENPFIGKVSPPSGPWNDSTAIVKVGPYRNRMNSPRTLSRTKRRSVP